MICKIVRIYNSILCTNELTNNQHIYKATIIERNVYNLLLNAYFHNLYHAFKMKFFMQKLNFLLLTDYGEPWNAQICVRFFSNNREKTRKVSLRIFRCIFLSVIVFLALLFSLWSQHFRYFLLLSCSCRGLVKLLLVKMDLSKELLQG